MDSAASGSSKRGPVKVYDPHLIPRIQKYLEENASKSFIDINEMCRSLRRQYKEYNRRRYLQFKKSVSYAHKIIELQLSSGSEGDENESQEEFDADLNEQPTGSHPNFLENMMNSMYSTQKPPASDAAQTIDISSDDDEGAVADSSIKPQLPPEVKIPSQVSILKVTKSTNGSVKSTDEPSKKRLKLQEALKSALPKKTNAKKSKFNKQFIFHGWESLGGINPVIDNLASILLNFFKSNQSHCGIRPTISGILLHGPPGSGKTLFARSIAGQLGLPIIEAAGTELIAGVTGESEGRIRDLFESANALDSECVLFIDEIDVISCNRKYAQRDMERRIVTQLIQCMDNLKDQFPNKILVIGATNSLNMVDPALRRTDRFDHEISLGIPNRAARGDILKILLKNLPLEDDFSINELAAKTPGYVGGDLKALIAKAYLIAEERVFYGNSPQPQNNIMLTIDLEDEPNVSSDGKDPTKSDETTNAVKENLNVENGIDSCSNGEINNQLEENDVVMEDMSKTKIETNVNVIESTIKEKPLTLKQIQQRFWYWYEKDLSDEDWNRLKITNDDFDAALKVVKPCAMREGFITVPDVKWSDIGSLQNIREELELAVLSHVKHPELLEKLGLNFSAGLLLFGPPGCGKTLVAKAVTNEAGLNFISVKGPELLNKYVGESERAIRSSFERAKSSAPCVIFFDEFDSLCPTRSSNGDSGSGARIVNQLLTEMDGVEHRNGVFIMAATNRPDMIDPAVLRPGRLDKSIFIGLPNENDRKEIISAITKGGTKPQLSSDVKLEEIAAMTENFSGADLKGMIESVSRLVLKEAILSNGHNVTLERKHFMQILDQFKPSNSAEDIKRYDSLKTKYESIKK